MFERKDIAKLKKDIVLDVELFDSNLKLHTRWGTFSPRALDDGTKLLMKYFSADIDDVCLDLGCGYGPIGLALAKHCSKGEVHMVDKDFVAVDLANYNAKINNIFNAFCKSLVISNLIKLFQIFLLKLDASNCQ